MQHCIKLNFSQWRTHTAPDPALLLSTDKQTSNYPRLSKRWQGAVKGSQLALLVVDGHRHLHVHTKSHRVWHITERGPRSAVSRNIAWLAAAVILFSSKLLLTCVKLSK